MEIHIVRRGETLWQIASQYHVDIQSIIQVNQLENPNELVVGQSLVIPTSGRTHIVRHGETLWQIAHQYGTTVQAIVHANRIPAGAILYAGTPLIIPRTKTTIESNAYTYQSPEEGAQSIKEVGDLLTYMSPFAYKVKEDATLEPFNDDAILDAAKSKQVTPLMSITNFTATETGSNVAHIILSNKDLREKTIENVLKVMDAKGYKGLNIDFENVLPADRENYNTFLQLAVDRLHPKGYFVSTALAPKTSADQGGLLYEAHDYPAHGRIADFVILMTYEWGYRLGPPQAISPIDEIKKVVEYALSVIPANKIFLGFQIYARDWKIPHVAGQEAETFSPQEAIQRAAKYGATIYFDETAQSPYYRYADEDGQQHEVWFEDARSAQAKFDLIKKFNLRGVSYWALGFPFPQNWALLNANFTIKKTT
ncbi:LysM peptidoglycan-binding domain-containing protein [Rummeliibacillus suwonensis]|uniref:LysM peptidoglycan-binding domain-containing protein n=1 Tax=Rummeliibacillus suwonensis TaxID=1306154 RepID=UPI001AAF972C|nr:LysM peptidoglycan-binding domain-containing protein [Rummeliibacillus suwonensis]MBO2537141.1 LysM peptidoglycan-binding domain-containing protein [Rummeliibacillus suwonensis]